MSHNICKSSIVRNIGKLFLRLHEEQKGGRGVILQCGESVQLVYTLGTF